MPGTKMSMFNYYYVLPRCAICHQIGYSPTAKFKRYQRKEHGSKLEQKIMHANELGYLLFDCQDCGLMVHPYCGVNGMEEKLDIEKLKWKCPDCQVKKEDHENKNCSICYQNYQSQEVFKNMKTQGQRAHLFCAMWNEKTSALDLCNGYMVQCYDSCCTTQFHPICGKNEHQYFEFLEYGLQVCAAFFCKFHSAPFIQIKIDNWKPRQSNKDLPQSSIRPSLMIKQEQSVQSRNMFKNITQVTSPLRNSTPKLTIDSFGSKYTTDLKNQGYKTTVNNHTQSSKNQNAPNDQAPSFNNTLINSRLHSVQQSPQNKNLLNRDNFTNTFNNLNQAKSKMLQTLQTQKINDNDTPKLTNTLIDQKAVTLNYKTHVSQAKKLNKNDLRKQIENEAFHQEYVRYSMQNLKDDNSSSRHFTSTQLDFSEKQTNINHRYEAVGFGATSQYNNHRHSNSMKNFDMWTGQQIQKHIQEITINVMKEENEHHSFVDSLNHFKDQQKSLDSNFDIIKQAFLKFSSNTIGIKVRDKMYDVYSRVCTLYTEYVKEKKSNRNEKNKSEEAREMLDQVGELVRILIRLFITENKIHIAQMLEKLFKMFVGFFDAMQDLMFSLIIKLENEITLLRKFKQHDQQASRKNKNEVLVDNLKDIQEEIEFIQQNAAIKNIYEEIELNTKKLEKFLGTVGDTTEKQIVNLKEMRNIINYDKIIKREFRKQVSVGIQTESFGTTRQELLLQAQRDIVGLDAKELLSTASLVNGGILYNYWKLKAKPMSEDYFVDQFVNLITSKLNSEIYATESKTYLNFAQYIVKKYLHSLKDPHQAVIELANMIKTSKQLNENLKEEQLYYYPSKALCQVYMYLTNTLYCTRRCFNDDKHFIERSAYQIICTAPETQNYLLLLFGDLFSKQNNQFEETNIEKLMKFMKQYFIEMPADNNEGYNHQKLLLQKIKHRVVRKFFGYLLILSESDNTRPLNLFDHFELVKTLHTDKQDISQYLQKQSFRDFKQQHEQLRKIKIEEHTQQVLCYLHLYDKDFQKNFHQRFKEKDDYFGASEIDQIIRGNYQDIVTKHDIKIVAQYFRLKFGDTMNIIQFDSEYDRAVELISYRSYNAYLCLNAMNMSLYSFTKNQINSFSREFMKAKSEYDHILDNKRVKGNQYEAINYQLYTRIMYDVNPTLSDEDIAKAFGSSIGMAVVKEQFQLENESDEQYNERKEQQDIFLMRKYLEVTMEHGLMTNNLLELNKHQDKKQMFGTKNIKVSKIRRK
eukprot:403348722